MYTDVCICMVFGPFPPKRTVPPQQGGPFPPHQDHSPHPVVCLLGEMVRGPSPQKCTQNGPFPHSLFFRFSLPCFSISLYLHSLQARNIKKNIFREYQIICVAALAPYGRLGQARIGQKYKNMSREYYIIFLVAIARYVKLGQARIGQKYKKHVQEIQCIMCGSPSSICQVRLGQDRLEI